MKRAPVRDLSGAVVDLGESISRRDVGTLLNLHQDSVSRLLHEGLAYAVIEWGGRGKTMTFSRWMVVRWERARRCRKRGGGPCMACAGVLEDCEAVGQHLLEERHGYGRCDMCTPPGQLCQPCSA